MHEKVRAITTVPRSSLFSFIQIKIAVDHSNLLPAFDPGASLLERQALHHFATDLMV